MERFIEIVDVNLNKILFFFESHKKQVLNSKYLFLTLWFLPIVIVLAALRYAILIKIDLKVFTIFMLLLVLFFSIVKFMKVGLFFRKKDDNFSKIKIFELKNNQIEELRKFYEHGAKKYFEIFDNDFESFEFKIKNCLNEGVVLNNEIVLFYQLNNYEIKDFIVKISQITNINQIDISNAFLKSFSNGKMSKINMGSLTSSKSSKKNKH